jgi:methyltransferase (TIGR00027 family)
MDATRPSRTAEHMAFFRALESLRPARVRLFEDPYASSFLGAFFHEALRVASIPWIGRVVPWIADVRVPGARSSGVARTRLIDEGLQGALARNIRQVVILGAGFDCRALRIPGMQAARCFEVDHPATLKAKHEKLRQARPELRPEIVAVQIDFNRQSLREVLSAAGFNNAWPTVFVWEGVTNYLSAEAVDVVLKFVASCWVGSELIFTYVHKSALDGSGTFGDAPKLLRSLEKIGEPWTFGLDPKDLESYLQARGLKLRCDTGAQEYRAKYMTSRGRHTKGYDFYRVAIADVSAATEQQSTLRGDQQGEGPVRSRHA